MEALIASPELESFMDSVIHWTLIITVFVLAPLSMFVGVPAFFIWLVRAGTTPRDHTVVPVNDTWVYVPLDKGNSGTRRSTEHREQTQASQQAPGRGRDSSPANRSHRSTNPAEQRPRRSDYWDED